MNGYTLSTVNRSHGARNIYLAAVASGIGAGQNYGFFGCSTGEASMTIAACYVSPEGVVLGADSTATSYVADPTNSSGDQHHFNYGQKIFEVGQGSSIAIATWGMGSFMDVSYRTLVARLGDELSGSAALSLNEVALRWSALFWGEYRRALAGVIQRISDIKAKGAAATADEIKELGVLTAANSCGFCVAGHSDDRRPEAYEILIRPDAQQPASPVPVTLRTPRFWGWSNLMERLLFGMDDPLFAAIMQSGKWTGTAQELIDIALANRITTFIDLPLRDAVDWVYSSIYTTIKALKFSHFRPACGGPIEIAVITTDRPFRWVRHKGLGEALSH